MDIFENVFLSSVFGHNNFTSTVWFQIVFEFNILNLLCFQTGLRFLHNNLVCNFYSLTMVNSHYKINYHRKVRNLEYGSLDTWQMERHTIFKNQHPWWRLETPQKTKCLGSCCGTSIMPAGPTPSYWGLPHCGLFHEWDPCYSRVWCIRGKHWMF